MTHTVVVVVVVVVNGSRILAVDNTSSEYQWDPVQSTQKTTASKNSVPASWGLLICHVFTRTQDHMNSSTRGILLPHVEVKAG